MIGQSTPDTESSPPEAPAAERKDAGREPEIGGREGPEPTRYGDWEKDGRCIDF
jgi:hypothetical protein